MQHDCDIKAAGRSVHT